MATLYVENIPDDVYEALRAQARKNRKSIAAEVLSLLQEAVPTDAELKRRERFLKQVERLRASKPPSPGPFPSTEQMLREDRQR
jgi:plasmid stability protein